VLTRRPRIEAARGERCVRVIRSIVVRGLELYRGVEFARFPIIGQRGVPVGFGRSLPAREHDPDGPRSAQSMRRHTEARSRFDLLALDRASVGAA